MTLRKLPLTPILPPEFTGQAFVNKLGIAPRELEVWRLIGLGESNEEIAARLYLTANTVKTHVARLFHKIGARNRADAAAIGLYRRVFPVLPDNLAEQDRALATLALYREIDRLNRAMTEHRCTNFPSAGIASLTAQTTAAYSRLQGRAS